MSKPLAGVRVLDLTHILSGPFATMTLADLGAEVVKVEPPEGERTRNLLARDPKHSIAGMGAYFLCLSRNKKSLVIDLKTAAGRELFYELVAHADIVCDNFSVGVTAKLGIDHDRLAAINPRIITCSVTGFGETGPGRNRTAFDQVVQAYGGNMSITGNDAEHPLRSGLPIADLGGSLFGLVGILTALYERERSGRGQHLDISILDCYYHCHEVNVHQCSGSDGAIQPTRAGRHLAYLCPAGIYRAPGGNITLMGFMHHWKDLCKAMGRPELATDVNYATDAARLAQRDQVVKMIEDWMAGFPDVATIIELLEAHGVPCAPVLSIAETLTHPHLVARGTVRTVNDRFAGEFQIPGMPIKTSEYPDNPDYRAPTLGEHNRELLGTLLGRSTAEIDALHASGTVIEGKM